MISKSDKSGWTKLVDLEANYGFDIGSVFRFPAIKPLEQYVDYMLVMPRERHFAIVSGQSAGWVFPPITVRGRLEGRASLNAEWLIKNWKEYVYAFCEPEDVYYIKKLPVPEYPPC